MAYLDSAGNVDPTAGAIVRDWANFHRAQQMLQGSIVRLAAPATALPAGGEKASKGTH